MRKPQKTTLYLLAHYRIDFTVNSDNIDILQITECKQATQQNCYVMHIHYLEQAVYNVLTTSSKFHPLNNFRSNY